MLERLEIHNFALIDHSVLQLDTGMTVISGETGAGKSIFIDALAALLGNRLSRAFLGQNDQEALIEAVFSVDPAKLSPDAQKVFQEVLGEDWGDDKKGDQAALPDSQEIILSREMKANGRTIARINGKLSKVGLLKDLGQYLVTIHGQDSFAQVFQETDQIEFLDLYGGEAIRQPLRSYQELLAKRRKLLAGLRKIGMTPQDRARELDLLQFQLSEIDEAHLQEGEEETLIDRQKQLTEVERILSGLYEAYTLLKGDEDHAVLTLLSQALKALEVPGRLVSDLAPTLRQFEEASEVLHEGASILFDYQEKIQPEEGEADAVEERLDLIRSLKAKYGDSLEEILAFRKQAEKRAEFLGQAEELDDKYHKALAQVEGDLDRMASLIHQARMEAAKILSQIVTQNLHDLNLPHAIFTIDIRPMEPQESGYFQESGRDEVHFMFTANPGHPPEPIERVASGGEAARVILGIKSVLAEAEKIPTLVFDEIDSGISGITAGKVAHKLHDLAKGRQVLCVSHTAQTASAADHHIYIEKNFQQHEGALATTSHLSFLSPSERVGEIARLLSGRVDDPKSRDLAHQMLGQYHPNQEDQQIPKASDEQKTKKNAKI